MSENELPNQNSNCSEHPMDYLNKAAEACAAGDMTLGLHLYLAAYEKAVSEPGTSTGLAVAALREAWHLACDLDRLEQYGFSREELQDMAEAISHDFLGGDASVVKVEHITIPGAGVFGGPDQLFADVSIDVEQIAASQGDATVAEEANAFESDYVAAEATDELDADDPDTEDVKPRDAKKLGMNVADTFNPYDYYPPSSEGTSWRAATNIGSGWSESLGFDGTTVFDSRFEGFSPVIKHEDESEPASDDSRENEAPVASDSPKEADSEVLQTSGQPQIEGTAQSPADQPVAETQIQAVVPSVAPASTKVEKKAGSSMPSMPGVAPVGEPVFNYKSLVGYDEAVAIMRDYGFGLQRDAGFISFVEMLNEKHGLNRMPAADTMLFRAPAIEDAARFVEATIGELGLPPLRMGMEEGVQGVPMLCVTADSSNRPRMNHQQNRFQGPAILVIDELDTWRIPEPPENVEGGMQAFMLANMTRGAREAINLIRSAVEDPNVIVLATSMIGGEVDPFFYEVLEPLTIIDIANPNEQERADIWAEIMQDHPSTRSLDVKDLVKYSAGLARYDIYMAAREAIEEAYKAGLVQRGFVPVTSQNILDKIAACQPFDSDEYHALEDRVVSDFVDSLDDLERLLDDQHE